MISDFEYDKINTIVSNFIKLYKKIYYCYDTFVLSTSLLIKDLLDVVNQIIYFFYYGLI